MSDIEHFRAIEEEEAVEPSLPVEDGSHPVYLSRGNPVSMLQLTLDPVLTDFGSSRSALQVNKDWWMPDTHRAPEILMGVAWDAQVDVWSIGIMALELLEGRNLFNPIDKAHKHYVLPLALSQYISYMGLPPLWMIRQSNNTVIKTFFNAEGHWIAEPPILEASLNDFVTSIEDCREKALFLDFINKILQWDPAKRGQSAHLFCHEWLVGPEPNGANGQ
ncbi:hypothetical protein AC578_10848 [Pseudocercospora eumusae]|uniref:Protein kinase domain-containing protein n=1 Tax=Pseudocercospora eumusae TaxID=321146 RepID=A0A139H8U6_9PEZI|nr:hypothetical protein AC578_10848 [Pseudocercospora eumusae]